MTIEELLAAMQSIIDEASASEASGGPGLTDEQASRYEELEAKLARARKSDELLKRHSAYKASATPALVTATPNGGDTLERAFSHHLRTGKPNAHLVAPRAQGETKRTQGGHPVPLRR